MHALGETPGTAHLVNLPGELSFVTVPASGQDNAG